MTVTVTVLPEGPLDGEILDIIGIVADVGAGTRRSNKNRPTKRENRFMPALLYLSFEWKILVPVSDIGYQWGLPATTYNLHAATPDNPIFTIVTGKGQIRERCKDGITLKKRGGVPADYP